MMKNKMVLCDRLQTVSQMVYKGAWVLRCHEYAFQLW